MRWRRELGDRTASHDGWVGSGLYPGFVGSGTLCFDVGANVGDRTARFLELGARVVSVEPQPECAATLRDRFGDRVAVVEAALGAAEGRAEMLIASYSTLSSLSPEWVEAVRVSGRFSEFTWDATRSVAITTLDALITDHGVPDFCKIDVEGYELEVVRGLSRPIPVLCFEFTVERLASRLEAIERLHDLGMREFNYSDGESMRLSFERWLDRDAIMAFLSSPAHSETTFGDVYARTGGRLTRVTW